MTALEDPRLEKSAANLLLSAWLTHFIYNMIVVVPLQVLEQHEANGLSELQPMMYGGLLKFDSLMRYCK
jgi:hypothetical protein